MAWQRRARQQAAHELVREKERKKSTQKEIKGEEMRVPGDPIRWGGSPKNTSQHVPAKARQGSSVSPVPGGEVGKRVSSEGEGKAKVRHVLLQRGRHVRVRQEGGRLL